MTRSRRLVPLHRTRILARFTLRDEEADLSIVYNVRAVNTSHVARALVSFMRYDK